VDVTPPLVVACEGNVLICRECSLYPPCYGYATSADPDTSGPDQMLDHLMRHPGYLGTVA
jgi:hypothetical protein